MNEAGGKMCSSILSPRFTKAGVLKVPLSFWEFFQYARSEISAKAQTIWFSHPIMSNIESSEGTEDEKSPTYPVAGSKISRNTGRKNGLSARVADARTSNHIDVLMMNRSVGLHCMRAYCGSR
jgi:hypothetical protein